MRIAIIITSLLLTVSCAGGGKTGGSGDSDCKAVTPWENLSPYINKCVVIKGEVTSGEYYSVKDYWIPIPELEKYKGNNVRVTGIVQTSKEKTGEQQSERGVYYIKVKSIDKLN